MDSSKPINVAGNKCTSTESSSRFKAVLAKIIAIPPASLTISPFSALPLIPLVLAPTVLIHGDSFETELATGPLFPAAATTAMPCSVARKLPMAMVSSKMGTGKPPRERERTSTPSTIAASIAARISEL
nr:hypothetical protein Ahy_A08g038926 [Ipomoea trifida]